MVDSHPVGGIVDYPLLALLLVLDDYRQGRNRPVLAVLSLELAEGPDKVAVLAHRNVVRHPG